MFSFSSFRLSIASLLGTIGNTLQLICLSFIPISFFQMLQASIVIFIPLISRFILKKKLYRYIFQIRFISFYKNILLILIPYIFL